jgi:RHS repeat-associated protein
MPLAASGTYKPRFGFSSKERDASGLVYYGFRFHSPDLCRWITPDPIREDGGMNLYEFCANDPVNHLDPDGDHPILIIAGLLLIGAEWANAPKDVDDPVYPGGEGFVNMCAAAGTGAALDIGLASARGAFAKWAAARAAAKTTVIGRVKDLQKLGPRERSLLDRLPDRGSAKANWKQNSGVLRQEMNRGLPIRDASPGDTCGQFLNAERYLLRERGWMFDPATSKWMPPQ